MMAELKPCPFCGAKPRIIYYNGDISIRRYTVKCVHLGCPCNPTTAIHDSADKATEAWNRRAGEQK